MFTGLIQNLGRIRQRGDLSLSVEVVREFENLTIGESIAVNGTCLTLERFQGKVLTFHTLSETLKRTNLGELPLKSLVNLERALRLGDALDGHLVSGHVDSPAAVKKWVTRPGGDMELTVELPESLRRFVAEKGSIAIDGVSLTVVAVRDDEFTVELIPVTRECTALVERIVGSRVNLEADLIARYVGRMLNLDLPEKEKKSEITMQTLYNAGFLQ